MRPRAGPRDIEVVAAGCRGVAGTAIRGHPVLKGIRLPVKAPSTLCSSGNCALMAIVWFLLLSNVPYSFRGGRRVGVATPVAFRRTSMPFQERKSKQAWKDHWHG
jgi:hypothetical protein